MTGVGEVKNWVNSKVVKGCSVDGYNGSHVVGEGMGEVTTRREGTETLCFSKWVT